MKIFSELNRSGTIGDLDELIQLTPAGLFDMMRIKGLGGKKLWALWKKAHIDNIEDLLAACRNDEIAGIKGFGAKTQANIINAIEQENASSERFHYAAVADAAESLLTSLQKVFKNDLLSLCGEIRRQSLTVERIELITTVPPARFKGAALKKLLHLAGSADGITSGHTLDEIPVRIHHTNRTSFYRQLFMLTGNAAHVEKVMGRAGKMAAVSSEEAIYKKAKLPFIVPEMREDVAEWEFRETRNNRLVTAEDIRGVVHNHTTYSDGADKLTDFVKACMRRGFEYTVISDHSRNAHYAGGLKEDKVLRQMAEIDALNRDLAPFRIFKSIECDILVSGELDYDKQLLSQFDLVIASVHQLLKMDEKKATARLIRAIENPFTTILGHMTGRQLLIRPGYPVDFKKVIDACAANKVVIELNTNPYRLDMDWSHIPYALKKGVMISLDPDAHSIGEIENIRWGVSAARKGGLTRNMTWNAMGLHELENWLAARRRARKIKRSARAEKGR